MHTQKKIPEKKKQQKKQKKSFYEATDICWVDSLETRANSHTNKEEHSKT